MLDFRKRGGKYGKSGILRLVWLESKKTGRTRKEDVKMRKIDKEYYEEKQGSLYLQYYSDLLDGTLKIYERQKKKKQNFHFLFLQNPAYYKYRKK